MKNKETKKKVNNETIDKNRAKSTEKKLEQISGGMQKYDLSSLSVEDCFIENSPKCRYRVIKDYIDIETGTKINVYCIETSSKEYINYNSLI